MRRSSKSWPWGSWAGRCAGSRRRRACGGRPPGGGGPPPKPAIEVSTDSVTLEAAPPAPSTWPLRPQRAPAASACEAYRDLIELAVARGRNAVAIWRDLVDDHGFPAQYASVRRFVGRLRGPQTPEAHPIIVTAPGEEGQVDYGDGPMVRHPITGKYRRTRLFVFTLGYSRKSVRLLTFASSTRGWCELHEEAFRRLGGTMQVVVLDNLREGVLKADIYDPALNPLYRDVLAHYGVVALPCWLGQEVAVQWNASHVRLLDPRTGQLLREHRRHARRGRHAIHPDDRPARTPPSTLTLLAQATRAGTHIGPLCAAIHRRQGEPGVRRILGVLSLVKKYGATVVDTACAAALELDVADYRFVRRYLERHPVAPLTLRQVDPLIRELTHYRDVIAQQTQEAIPTGT